MSNIFIIRNFNSKILQNKNSKEYIERKIYHLFSTPFLERRYLKGRTLKRMYVTY